MKKFFTIIVFLFMAFGIGFVCSSCSNDVSIKDITNLSYDGETITWSSVLSAKNYKIRINNGTEAIVSQTISKVSYDYDSGGEDFNFYIEAVIKENSDKNPKLNIRFENIGKVGGLAIEHGNLIWDELAGAEKYEIMYNDKVVSSDVRVASYETTPGNFSYKVRALKDYKGDKNGNNPYYSVWSDAITGKILSAPTNLIYDSEIFTWDSVQDANSYVLKIDNREITVSTTRYEYVAGTSNFTASVYAVGDNSKKIYDSLFCEEQEYKYITPVEGLNVEDGVLKWTASDNAVRYKIKINGIISNEELTTNEYTALSSGSSYRIQIMPIGKNNFYFSHWSNEITVNILRSPVVSYSDGVIRWNQVTGCAGYDLKITKEGSVIHTTSLGEETFVYDYAFESAGEYLVYVKATALGTGGIYESKYSNGYSVKRLETPSNAQIINRPLEQNQVSVTFTPIDGASGYSLLADGVEIASVTSESTFSVDLSKMTNKNEESVVNFKIIAKGIVTTNGAILDCNIPLEFNVTKLATPQNLNINGNQISWDSVNHTSKYVLTIDGKRIEVTTTSFTLTDLSSGTHSVYVQAMGNGEEVITSGFSNSLSLKKLATPANLNIKNGLLTWDIIPDATAYKVILGTETYNTDGTSFNLLGYESNIFEGRGTQISVYAIGNGTNIIDSDVSATRTISKYSRPTNVKVNGDNLVWNPVSVNSINCNSYMLLISNGVDEERIEYVTGSSYSMSNFAAGNYSVAVVAVGDNIQTLNSPESDSFVFTKLENITNVVKNGDKYTWDNVVGASSYEIKLSKDATWTTVNTNSYKPAFTTEGEFEVSIRAVGNGIDIISSEVYSFTQRVSRLTQPVEQNEMTYSNAFKVEIDGNNIIVTVKKQDGATGYKLFIDGIERNNIISETDTELVFSFTVVNALTYSYRIQVQVLGNNFTSNGIYMMDSNKSTEVNISLS